MNQSNKDRCFGCRKAPFSVRTGATAKIAGFMCEKNRKDPPEENIIVYIDDDMSDPPPSWCLHTEEAKTHFLLTGEELYKS